MPAAPDFPVYLASQTPCCQLAIRLPRMRYATEAVVRSCRKCKRHWRVIIRPLGANATDQVHQLDWVEITMEAP